MKKKRLILSAFNVHTGGGFTLLNELLSVVNPNKYFLKALLDLRTKNRFSKIKINKIFIERKIFSRIFYFFFNTFIAKENIVTFCFNGLPPFFKNKSQIVSYVQTFYFTESPSGYEFPLFVRLRIFFEKLWFWTFYNNIDEIWVQTNHIKKKISRVIFEKSLKKKKIRIVPFVSTNVQKNLIYKGSKLFKLSNCKNKVFFYPSDLSAHKNHINLIKAFKIFRSKNKNSILYLTLSNTEFQTLQKLINYEQNNFSGIINLGRISHKKVLGMFKKSILLFPSYDETFGLPLIEASSIGTPIVASNKDFVKEICLNAYLFNPRSPKSISLNMEKCIQNLKKTKCLYEKKNINNGKSFINLLITT